jgi:pantetheine-phosphate adenylyltransferase
VPATHLAIYAGSFDPPTKGHLDLIERASKLFDKLIVGIGIHPTRRPLFSTEERTALLKELTADLDNVEVQSFHGLLIDFCEQQNARVIVRGLRAATDFEYELQIAHANAELRPLVDTVFLPTRASYGFVSASLVREIASHGGDVSKFAPSAVCTALRAKFAKNDPTGLSRAGRVERASPSVGKPSPVCLVGSGGGRRWAERARCGAR